MTALRVELHGPLDVDGSLEGLRRWGDDLIDRWDGHRLLRVVRLGGRPTAVRAAAAGTIDAPALHVGTEGEVDPTVVADEIRGWFIDDPATTAALGELAGHDPVVAAVAAAHPGLRPLLYRDPMVALVRSISAQQVNLAWAATIRRRLAERYGVAHSVGGDVVYELPAEALAGADPVELRALQLTNAKAASVVACARAVVGGRVALEVLDALADDEVIARLVEVRGIGRWSAEWFLARTLGRPRVVAGDLGVRKAVGRAYLDGVMPSEAEVRAATAHWGEAAGLVQQLLLHDLAEASARRRDQR